MLWSISIPCDRLEELRVVFNRIAREYGSDIWIGIDMQEGLLMRDVIDLLHAYLCGHHSSATFCEEFYKARCPLLQWFCRQLHVRLSSNADLNSGILYHCRSSRQHHTMQTQRVNCKISSTSRKMLPWAPILSSHYVLRLRAINCLHLGSRRTLGCVDPKSTTGYSRTHAI